MRAVLRTLAQCHSHHILHRDVKPGNFMLASDDEAAPLKAIDFGLAVPFDPAALPMTELGLEGTPWCAGGFCSVSFVAKVFMVCMHLIPFVSQAASYMHIVPTHCAMSLGICLHPRTHCELCILSVAMRAVHLCSIYSRGAVRSGGRMHCMSAHGVARAGSWRQRC